MDLKEKVDSANKILNLIGIKGKLQYCEFIINAPKEPRIMCIPKDYNPFGFNVSLDTSGEKIVFYLSRLSKDVLSATDEKTAEKNRKTITRAYDLVDQLNKLDLPSKGENNG